MKTNGVRPGNRPGVFLWAAHGGWRRHALLRAYGDWESAAEAMLYPAAERGVRTFLWEAFGAPHVLSDSVPSVPNPLKTFNAHGVGSLNTLDFRAAWLADRTKQGHTDNMELESVGRALAIRFGCPLAVKLGINPAAAGVREDVLRWTVAYLKRAAVRTVCIDAAARGVAGTPERRLLNALASAGLETLVEPAQRQEQKNSVPFGSAWLYRFEHVIRRPNALLYVDPSSLRASGRECVIALGGPDFVAPETPKGWADLAAVYAMAGFSPAVALSEHEVNNGTLDAIVDAVGSV